MTIFKHSVTNMKFWYERISEYNRIDKYNTNECLNIFVSKKGYEFDRNEYSWRKIFEYPNIQHTMIWKIWYERISEYIRIKKMIRTNIRIYSYQKKDTNMIRTNIRGGKYSNIFEYPNIRHTMLQDKPWKKRRHNCMGMEGNISQWPWFDTFVEMYPF